MRSNMKLQEALNAAIFLLFSSATMLGHKAYAGLLEPRQEATSSGAPASASPPAATPTAASSQSASSAKSTITVTPSASPSASSGAAAATTTTSGATDPAVATATYTGTALPSGSTVPESDLQMCTEEASKQGPFPPFCEPRNGTSKETGKTYFITWWTGAFAAGTQISAKLDYRTNESQNAWHTDAIDKNMGFAYLPVEEALLKDGNPTDLTLTLVANNPDDDAPARILPGPTLTVAKPAATHLPAPPPTHINTLGLAVGLPLAVAVIVLILVVLTVSTRAQRVVGLGNVMGRGRRGYGVGRSRRQRVGTKAGPALGVSEAEFDPAVPGFRDDPRVDDDIELRGPYRGDTGAGGNAFREEIDRQRAGGR